ncbi:MAG TPA: site-specific integrase [Mycobacterium sp.]|jgi:integrase|nr:site-specific integrase [Mycobacterium sp.]
MGKRQFGTVRKLPSGKWQARYRDRTGDLVTAPSTFHTKGDASRWLSNVETEQARGGWIDPRAGEIPLETYAAEWLETKVRLAPRTREIYDTQLRLHINPSLGRVNLVDISPEDVRGWYADLVAERGASVAAKAYVRLKQILAQAVNDDRIAKSPCRIANGGAEHHAEQRFATLPQLYKLADAVPERYRALVLTAGLGGLRIGELAALRRKDVDLINRSIHVRRKRVRLASGEVIEGDPKSEAGRRVVALPDTLVLELEKHMRKFTDDRATVYVFTSQQKSALDRSTFRKRVWLPATKKVGLTGLRFHDLRHTAGTLAARTGATTKELMARLGHASPRAAMIYQHATADRDEQIAAGLAAMTREAGLAEVVPLKTRDAR